ncbi:MAG: PEGA domain-containing protein [Alphaproteobacteria bacterium]|nr:PEGA domain-containing protein [Alphaproteobacteria bacterium]
MSARHASSDPLFSALTDDGLGPPSSRTRSTPDIAPPLLLEPIPPPVVTTPASKEAFEPEDTDDLGPGTDPYAWASSAASAMEREGRVFDTDAFEVPAAPTPDPGSFDSGKFQSPAPTPQPVPAPAPTPAGHARPARGPLRAPTGAPPVRQTPPPIPAELRRPPRRPRGPGATAPTAPDLTPAGMSWGVLGTIAAVGAFVVVLLILVVVFRPQEEPLRALQPVAPELEALVAEEPDLPFARPPENLPVAPGQRSGFRATPRTADAATTAEVRVRTTPAGAYVRIDGRRIGPSPATVSLAPGTHVVELTLAGHDPVEQQLVVGREPVGLDVQLQKQGTPGHARVVAKGWEGSRLIVDGRVAGMLPVVLELEPGRHRFVVDFGTRQIEFERAVRFPSQGIVDVDLLSPP